MRARFDDVAIDHILTAAKVTRLQDHRDALWANVDPDFRDLVAAQMPPWPQLMFDIGRLNRAPELASRQDPMLAWLRAARQLVGRFSAASSLLWAHDQLLFGDTQLPTAEARGDLDRRARDVPLDKAQELLEALIGGQDATLPVDFLKKGVAAAQRVAKVLVPRWAGGQRLDDRESKGTGWLLTRRHVMTNYHVVHARDLTRNEALPGADDLRTQAQNATVVFDYDREAAGTQAQVKRLLTYHSSLDFAVLELAEDASVESPLDVLDRDVRLRDDERSFANIIQHPGGAPKRLGCRENLLVAASADDLAYFTATRRGSSGSPVCDDQWRVIGLHRASRPHAQAGSINVATPIRTILEALRANELEAGFRGAWAELQAHATVIP
ncbi:MAG: trypsin-like peptidase domain-containing protein [Planctomycetota bacterium]|nr:trypsin-like peptidase domain-containing protein [Planctomycetota bacterium]